IGIAACLEQMKVRPGLWPAPVRDLRLEDDGSELPRRRFHRTVDRAAPADRDDRVVTFDTVESDRSAIIHRKGDGRTIRPELGVGDPRKRLREVHLASGKTEDGLLGRNGAYQRREIHTQVTNRTPELIDIRKSKYPWRR